MLQIDKNIRIRARELSDIIQEEERKVSRRIRKESEPLTKALREERESLWKIEKDFRESFNKLFKEKTIVVGTEIVVEVQVGPNGGEIIRSHKGKVMKIYNHSDVCFDLSDPDFINGKKFTIGGSCVKSIQVINEIDVIGVEEM